MNSNERPFSAHFPEERECAFCGTTFLSHHGLQQYCPEKFGKKDYCKYQQKKLMSEKKLIEKAKQLADIGMEIKEDNQPPSNFAILAKYMGSLRSKFITSTELDENGFKISEYDFHYPIPGTTRFGIQIGQFRLEWYAQENDLLTFKINRL